MGGLRRGSRPLATSGGGRGGATKRAARRLPRPEWAASRPILSCPFRTGQTSVKEAS